MRTAGSRLTLSPQWTW